MSHGQTTRATGLAVPWGALDGAGALHGQVVRMVKEAVVSGRLAAGSRMPSTRSWAQELGLSRWVVTEAYEQLIAEGYLVAQAGSGTRVAELATAPRTRDRLPARGKRLRDLSPAAPDVRLFPRSAWRAAQAHAIAHLSDADLAAPPAQGLLQLRETLAASLHRTRSLPVDPADVHITSGTRSAMPLLMSLLAQQGISAIGVEDPGWPHAREAAAAHGLSVVRVEDRRAGAVLVTPAHQFPLGNPMSPERRIALARWAVEGGHLVIEDDYDAEFRYDRSPLGALAALAPDHVLHVGSTSKTLGPALHLGWVAAPAHLGPELARARAAVGMAVPVLDQAALARLIETGAYDRHVRLTRRNYQARRRAFVAALIRNVPGELLPALDAGLHVVWMLPGGNDEATVVQACRAAGLNVTGLGVCRVRPGPPGLLLGFAGIAEHEAETVTRVLARTIT